MNECRWKKIAQVISVIACTDHLYKDRSGKLKCSLRTDEKKKDIRNEYQKSQAYVLEDIISTINPSLSPLSAEKSLGIKPPPAAQLFSADKRSGSGIHCMHIFWVERRHTCTKQKIYSNSMCETLTIQNGREIRIWKERVTEREREKKKQRERERERESEIERERE